MIPKTIDKTKLIHKLENIEFETMCEYCEILDRETELCMNQVDVCTFRIDPDIMDEMIEECVIKDEN